MAYQAPYSGLAQLMELQGRRGDSMLVHMNPMEVRMLEAMSPDGRLSINPDTGLPEAFKLKDILSVALPIAGGALLGPAVLGLAPGLGALGATAVGTGIGGLGAGLIQGKGLGDSLIQGGLSGLMSYGLGSLSGAFAPSGGVTAGPPSGPDVFGEATASPFGIGATPEAGTLTTVGTPESTGFFGGLGETLRQTPFTDVPSVGSPTYGSMLGSGASGLLASGLTTEQMPYDVADVGMDYPYYDADLEGGRLRGRAAARQLQSPPSFLTSRGLYERAISPGGGGTFFAADGGRVPTDLNINGQPHQLSYINQEEADLLRSLGGSGQDVMGIPAYFDAGEATAGEGAPDDGSGVGAAADGTDSAPGADMGVGGYSDAQAAAVTDAMDAAISEADAEAAAIGEQAAYGDISSQAVGMGFGGSQGAPSMSPAAVTNSMIGRGIMDVLSPVPTFAMRGIAKGLGNVATALGVPGVTESASAAVASQEASDDGSGGDSPDGLGIDSGVYGRPYGDPYNTEKVQVTPTPAPSPVGATALRSLSPTAPRTAGDIFGAATTGGIPRFFTGMAQGGVVHRQDGGNLTADDLYSEATDSGIQRRLPMQQFVPSQTQGVRDALSSTFPGFSIASESQVKQSGLTLADIGRLQELMRSGPPAFRLMGLMGGRFAQGGGISSLAYGGDPAPVGFANRAFEGMVPGTGTGMSDDVPFSIEGQQPALLSRDEYVLPADVVSQLGDGSSSAGADMLDNFISQVRQTKYGNTQQPAPVGPQLMTGLMRQGGVV